MPGPPTAQPILFQNSLANRQSQPIINCSSSERHLFPVHAFIQGIFPAMRSNNKHLQFRRHGTQQQNMQLQNQQQMQMQQQMQQPKQQMPHMQQQLPNQQLQQQRKRSSTIELPPSASNIMSGTKGASQEPHSISRQVTSSSGGQVPQTLHATNQSSSESGAPSKQSMMPASAVKMQEQAIPASPAHAVPNWAEDLQELKRGHLVWFKYVLLTWAVSSQYPLSPSSHCSTSPTHFPRILFPTLRAYYCSASSCRWNCLVVTGVGPGTQSKWLFCVVREPEYVDVCCSGTRDGWRTVGLTGLFTSEAPWPCDCLCRFRTYPFWPACIVSKTQREGAAGNATSVGIKVQFFGDDTQEKVTRPHVTLRPFRCSSFDTFAQAGKEHPFGGKLFADALQQALDVERRGIDTSLSSEDAAPAASVEHKNATRHSPAKRPEKRPRRDSPHQSDAPKKVYDCASCRSVERLLGGRVSCH